MSTKRLSAIAGDYSQAAGIVDRQQVVAIGGEVTFKLIFIDGAEEIYINGIRLLKGADKDYVTDQDTGTIVLSSPLIVGDEILLIGRSTIAEIPEYDAVSKQDGVTAYDGTTNYGVNAVYKVGGEIMLSEEGGLGATSTDSFVMTSLLSRIFHVGYLFHSTSPESPAALGYPGTWEELDPETTLSTGGTLGQYVGSNLQDVPIPLHDHALTGHTHVGSTSSSGIHGHDSGTLVAANGGVHSHSINHDHPSATTSTDTHSHTYTRAYDSGPTTGDQDQNSRYTSYTTSTTSGDSHNHTVNLPNFSGTSGASSAHGHTLSGTTADSGNHTHSVTVSSGGEGTTQMEGVDGVQMDVRGRRFSVHIWRRTL